jgi:hypothetical protein
VTQSHEGGAARIPASAAGHLEPFGVRVELRVGAEALDPGLFVTALLEGLAASCLQSGASVIGHLKCLLRTPDGTLACSLTSPRSGARCQVQPEPQEFSETPAASAPAASAPAASAPAAPASTAEPGQQAPATADHGRARHSGPKDALPPMKRGEAAHLDLAILVYGLPVDTVARLVRTALGGRLGPAGTSWSITA